jgi:hypothetical protein
MVIPQILELTMTTGDVVFTFGSIAELTSAAGKNTESAGLQTRLVVSSNRNYVISVKGSGALNTTPANDTPIPLSTLQVKNISGNGAYQTLTTTDAPLIIGPAGGQDIVHFVSYKAVLSNLVYRSGTYTAAITYTISQP